MLDDVSGTIPAKKESSTRLRIPKCTQIPLSDMIQHSTVGRIRGANINTTAYIAVVAGSERILAESINTKFSLYSLSKCLLTALQPKASEQAWIQSHLSVHRGAGGPA